MPDRLTIATIDLSAYTHNLGEIRKKLSPGTKIMSVIKANAYGHGAVEIAKAAVKNNVDYLGVACLFEARELRQAGITAPILILNYIDSEGAKNAIDLGCAITVMDHEIITAVGKYKKPAKLHLKVDTGMHRAGASPAEVLELVKTIQTFPYLKLEGIFTHFSNADDIDLSFAREQLKVFKKVIQEISALGVSIPITHAANSAATLALPEAHFDMIRPGIITYGLSPFDSSHPLEQQFLKKFKPVLSLKTQIVRIQEINPGESVGYGRTFIAQKPTRVGLLPVGYADGFNRSPHHWGEVLVHGKRVPILGRISMDQSSIDLTSIPDVKIHDEVVLLGKQGDQEIKAEDVAIQLGTIDYDIVSSLAARITREYKE